VIKHLTALLAIFLCVSTAANARCTGSDAFETMLGDDRNLFDAEIAAFPYGKGRYWEVTKDGKRSVLIGTFHVPDTRITHLHPSLVEEISGASILLVELSHADEKHMETALAADPSIMFDLSGKQLRDDLSAEHWDELPLRSTSCSLGLRASPSRCRPACSNKWQQAKKSWTK